MTTLKLSCAITLARKFKLPGRTARSAFKKFGPQLCFLSEKGKKTCFYIPDNLRMLPESHRFKGAITKSVDDILRAQWSSGLTLPQFDEGCVICKDPQVEIHHIRAVKDVRGKYYAPETRSFAQFRGAFLRKYIPLCKKHHVDLHAGRLSLAELLSLAAYRGKMKVAPNKTQ